MLNPRNRRSGRDFGPLRVLTNREASANTDHHLQPSVVSQRESQGCSFLTATRKNQSSSRCLRSLNPDIILLQEVQDYDACARLGEAIAPGVYHVAICSAFREPSQSEIGRQQVAILSKHDAQAAWAEPWKSMDGVDPPRGFAFAWFRIHGASVGVYCVHLKSNLIKSKDKSAATAINIGSAKSPRSNCSITCKRLLPPKCR